MVHTRLNQKSEFNNFRQWLEQGKKDNVPTFRDLERACTGQSRMMWKMEFHKKSWKLTTYVSSWQFFLRVKFLNDNEIMKAHT